MAGRPVETVDRAAYTFCVLEQFHRHLKHRNIFVEASSKWRDPRAHLLTGASWEVAARLDADTPAMVDDDGKLHAAALTAVSDPPSLNDLRRRVEAMLPRIDLPELVLEVMSWHPGFTEAFTHASGNPARVADLGLSVAAVLCAHAMNVGFAPVTSPGVEALTRDRLQHVDQSYIRFDTLAAANTALVEAQARTPLAQVWGGGLVASDDTHLLRRHGRPVAVGGLIGAPARYALGLVFPHSSPGQWPMTTFAINIVGAFVLGGLLEALARLGPDTGWRQRVRLCLGTGVIGSFTTYSTLAVDIDLLLRARQVWPALTYGLGTVITGMVATAAGIGAGAWMSARHGREQR